MTLPQNKQIETNLVFGMALLSTAPESVFSLERSRGSRPLALQQVIDLLGKSPFFAAQAISNRGFAQSDNSLTIRGCERVLDALGVVEVYFGADAFYSYFSAPGAGKFDSVIYNNKAKLDDKELIMARLQLGLEEISKLSPL